MNRQALKIWKAATEPVITKAGSVRLLDVMPHPVACEKLGMFSSDPKLTCLDNAIAEAARVSVDGKKRVRDNGGLVKYLMEHKHWSPFQMCELKWLVHCPMSIGEQWLRHVGDFNKISGRYVEWDDEFYYPELRKQAKTNKQASAGLVDDEVLQQEFLEFIHNTKYEQYRNIVRKGGAREVARFGLPSNLMTKFIYKTNLRNFLIFTSLRDTREAQVEIRDMAHGMSERVRHLCPITMNAFENYYTNAVVFSHDEQLVLRRLMSGGFEKIIDAGMPIPSNVPLGDLNRRQAKDFWKKIKNMGII